MIALQPSATAAMVSNWAETTLDANRGSHRPDCFAYLTHRRAGMKARASDRPAWSGSSTNSASVGAELNPSTPIGYKARPSATSGWTSSRDPQIDNSRRIFTAQGACRKSGAVTNQ